MNGDWDVENLPELIYRVVAKRCRRTNMENRRVAHTAYVFVLSFLNPRASPERVKSRKSTTISAMISNEKMLGETMVYSCGYWNSPARRSENSRRSAAAKLDLACRKLGLKAGDRILDIGCGWGSMLKHAAKKLRCTRVG